MFPARRSAISTYGRAGSFQHSDDDVSVSMHSPSESDVETLERSNICCEAVEEGSGNPQEKPSIIHTDSLGGFSYS